MGAKQGFATSSDNESMKENVNRLRALCEAMFRDVNLKKYSLNQRVAGSIPASPTNAFRKRDKAEAGRY